MMITRESSGRELALYALVGLAFVGFAVGWAIYLPDSSLPVGWLGLVFNTAILFGGVFQYLRKKKVWRHWKLWAVLISGFLIHLWASLLIIGAFERPLTILMLLYFVEYPTAGLILDLTVEWIKKSKRKAFSLGA